MTQYDTIIETVIDTIYLQSSSNDMDIIKNIVELSNSSISSQISTLNAFIAGFSLIFVIAGIILGIYISNLEKKVVKIKDSVEEKEKEIITLAETVKETDEKIQSDFSGLYSKLRDEESVAILKRLIEEPEDVTNLSHLLLARKLKQEWFPLLKTAFLKLLKLGEVANESDFVYPSYKEQYLLLLFQHYLYDSILDNEIRTEILSFFPTGFQCAFKSDIIRSTEDLCKALSTKAVAFNKETILIEYLKALNNSKYKDLVELKNILEESLTNKDLLPTAIEKCSNNKIYMKLFGITPLED